MTFPYQTIRRDELERLRTDLRTANFRLAVYQSAYGAGPPGRANCDGLWQTKFARLDEDYEKLHKEHNKLWSDFQTQRIELTACKSALNNLGVIRIG